MAAEINNNYAVVEMVRPFIVADEGVGIVAVCGSRVIAERLAELWDRHGLADVHDTAEGVHL
jgi:hypothetical protein